MGQITYEQLTDELAKKIKDSIDITSIATDTKLGVVKVDGTTVTIDAEGVITAVGGGSGGLTTADIVDNLTSDDATKVLSAKQGKEIKTLIDGAGTVKSVNTKTPDVSGEVTLVAGDVDAFTKTEVNVIKDQLDTDILEVQTNLDTHEGKVASVTELGHVKIDGATITLNGENQLVSSLNAADKAKLDGIEAEANKYVLPTASNTVLGGIKPDGVTVSVDSNGILSNMFMPTIKHYQTTRITDPDNPYKRIFLLDFTREDNDFLEVIFNDVVLDIGDFQFVNAPEGSAIRLNITEMVDYDTALVHGFLYRGFNILK